MPCSRVWRYAAGRCFSSSLRCRPAIGGGAAGAGRIGLFGAGPDAPEQLNYTRVAPPPGEPDDEADPLAGLGFSRLIFGETRDDKAINIRLKPKHPGGKRRDLGDLAADYLEVRVRYTHPEPEE